MIRVARARNQPRADESCVGRRPAGGNICTMKIATYNINSIRNRLPRLLEWLDEAQPDAVCLQELRIYRRGVSRCRRSKAAGYGAIWRGQKPRYNGVAILARGTQPVRRGATCPAIATTCRPAISRPAINGVLVGCLYAPNGNPQPGPKFDYKLAWLARLARHAKSPARFGRTRRARRRLQRGADACGHLRDDFIRRRRARAAAKPGCVRHADRTGMDRHGTRAASRARRSTRSGTTCASGGNATPACASTISSSTRRCASASSPRAWTAKCVGAPARATRAGVDRDRGLAVTNRISASARRRHPRRRTCPAKAAPPHRRAA